jgi:hypothetical protein
MAKRDALATSVTEVPLLSLLSSVLVDVAPSAHDVTQTSCNGDSPTQDATLRAAARVWDIPVLLLEDGTLQEAML